MSWQRYIKEVLTCIILASGALDPFIGPDFVFENTLKPSYIGVDANTVNGTSPLVIKLAIISRVDAFERRQAIRESVLDGVPQEDVTLEYKFFVGRVPLPLKNHSVSVSRQKAHDEETRRIMRRIDRENEVYGDVLVVEDVEDIPERVAEKRFAALKWANDTPKEMYDYAMTMDSDTFCRFSTLARRMRYDPMYVGLRPREDNILIGRMSEHRLYWENTVTDNSRHANRNTNGNGKKDVEEDRWMTGPSYPYPIGIGYMLSSHLTATMLSADPELPHHIHYPYDDVMIGSWVAGLKILHDSSATFYPKPSKSSDISGSMHLPPYLPYQVNTTVVDDKIGWHDYKRRGLVAHAVGWETVCVHRLLPEEMKKFRKMKEVRMEWDY
ncbi:Beta-1,3-galactosyltransferase sqv-2 [Psilocybe cubensis]|uniref:Beta-1,3-galactosyltransferase sqv-2 n=1 Tax=Psilocybe cubensis TaxID=181762 RepID=A0ACB8GWC8_PSICU|nr:Beta-1,3-galactosyltransferase sqv-2 [Psilocybe cubensis]KAH9479931.1 Beta-1,3-galactosyltransferase sqv-2 [Psilocybe cubensis]